MSPVASNSTAHKHHAISVSALFHMGAVELAVQTAREMLNGLPSEPRMSSAPTRPVGMRPLLTDPATW
jgi:hypothetical protein